MVIESDRPFIPRALIIRNHADYWGVHTMELSLATRFRDGTEFEKLAVISEIRNDVDWEQYVQLDDEMLQKMQFQTKWYNFVKLRILKNWGGPRTIFHSFALLGVSMEPTDDPCMSILMSSVQMERHDIVNESEFPTLKKKWIPRIAEHPLIFQIPTAAPLPTSGNGLRRRLEDV